MSKRNQKDDVRTDDQHSAGVNTKKESETLPADTKKHKVVVKKRIALEINAEDEAEAREKARDITRNENNREEVESESLLRVIPWRVEDKPNLKVHLEPESKRAETYPETYEEVYEGDRKCVACGKEGAYVIKDSYHRIGKCREHIEGEPSVKEVTEVRE